MKLSKHTTSALIEDNECTLERQSMSVMDYLREGFKTQSIDDFFAETCKGLPPHLVERINDSLPTASEINAAYAKARSEHKVKSV